MLALNNNRSLTKAVTYNFYISPTMYVYCVYSAMSYSKNKQLTNCLKRAETDIVLRVLDVRAYSVSFSASLDMNQVPEKLYLGQNLNQYVMKEAVIYKILRYRQNRCHTNEERWTDHS